MNYGDKCLLAHQARVIAQKKDIDILAQFGILKGKNTASITINGKERLFTDYQTCKAYLNSL